MLASGRLSVPVPGARAAGVFGCGGRAEDGLVFRGVVVGGNDLARDDLAVRAVDAGLVARVTGLLEEVTERARFRGARRQLMGGV